jgi:hypothetical protein
MQRLINNFLWLTSWVKRSFTPTLKIPPGFGLRQPSGAFSKTNLPLRQRKWRQEG